MYSLTSPTAKYFNVSLWNNETFLDLIPRLANEFDVP